MRNCFVRASNWIRYLGRSPTSLTTTRSWWNWSDAIWSVGLKKPKTGRRGLTPNQVLRSLILMRIKNWDYRELCERIRDGYTLRNFTGFYSQPVPKHNAFNQA